MASATAGDVLIADFVSRLADRFAGPSWGVRRRASLSGSMQIAFHFGRSGEPYRCEGEFGAALALAHRAGAALGDALYHAAVLQDQGAKAREAAEALPLNWAGRDTVFLGASMLEGVAAQTVAAAQEKVAAFLAAAVVEG